MNVYFRETPSEDGKKVVGSPVLGTQEGTRRTSRDRRSQFTRFLVISEVSEGSRERFGGKVWKGERYVGSEKKSFIWFRPSPFLSFGENFLKWTKKRKKVKQGFIKVRFI